MFLGSIESQKSNCPSPLGTNGLEEFIPSLAKRGESNFCKILFSPPKN